MTENGLGSFAGFRFTEPPRFPHLDELWDGDRPLMLDGYWLAKEDQTPTGLTSEQIHG